MMLFLPIGGGVSLLLLFALLYAAAALLITSDPLRKTDAIAVLSGDPKRLDYAHRLRTRGYASTLVVTFEESIRIAVERGGEAEGMVVAAPGQEDYITTTYREAIAMRLFAEERGFTSLMVVTSPYHTRRAHHIYHLVFAHTDIAVAVVPVDPHWYHPTAWWQKRLGWEVTISEHIKLLLTWVLY
jgi:uncharacterized SAM-binding protein YcdF (DUF218 family)